MRSLSIIATASTSRSPALRLGRRDQPLARGQIRAATAGWLRIRRQQHRRVPSPTGDADRPRRRQRPRHPTGISSVYCTSPPSNSMASTGTSDGRRGSTRMTVIALLLWLGRSARVSAVISSSPCGFPSSASSKSATICTSSRSRMRGAPTPLPTRGIGTCTVEVVAR